MDNKEKLIRMMQHTATDLHVRESTEEGKESRTITGRAILFNTPSVQMWSYYEDEEVYEVISKGAITKELLDGCDIKMTMFHNRELILARSNKGTGTLKYNVDDEGVTFEFDAPNTVDGDKALDLVRRGDLAGCSFMFTTHYYDEAYVKPEVTKRDGKTIITYHVNVITGVYDFTLAADPAYPDTSVEAEIRELTKMITRPEENKPEENKPEEDEHQRSIDDKVAELRKAAETDIFI